jgi:hypothetical protein
MGPCNRHLLISLVCLVGLATGCKGKDSPYAAYSSPSNGTTPPGAPTVSAAAPLALRIFSIYDKQEYVNNFTFTETGTTTCSASAATPVVTCTISVPEGRMWLSSFSFSFAWLASKCTLMTFQPYYYQRSASAGYVPPGSTDAVDCSALPTSAACFNGAAVSIVQDFPKNGAILYTPDETDLNQVLSDTVKLESSWSQGKLSNNLLVANDMPVGKRGANHDGATFNTALLAAAPYYGAYVGTDYYMADTFVDYQLSCRDDWFDLQTYTINLNITEEDSASTTTPAQNHFATWKDLP